MTCSVSSRSQENALSIKLLAHFAPGSDTPIHNGSSNPESGQSHNDTSANGNDFPQTADPMGNSKIVLVVLAHAGAFGLFVTSIQKRRVQASIKRKV